MINKIINKLRSAKTGVLTSIRKLKKGSDYKTWGNELNLSPDWDSRTKRIAKLVDANKSVIEFGAGRIVLKKYLPKGCTYTPSDLVDRGKGTIVCDLNDETLPKLQSYDIAVFSGVLEYINDVPRLITYLADCVGEIIASYAVTDLNKQNRRANGWVNDFSSKELIDVLESAGFRCDHIEKWESQLVYRFKKKHGI